MTITGWSAWLIVVGIYGAAATVGALAATGQWVPLAVFVCLYCALALLTHDRPEDT